MAKLAVTIILIFSLFLLSYARLQHNQPENQVVEWNQLPSTSNGLLVPDSASESELDAAELPGSDIISFAPLTEISETSTRSKNEHLHHGFHFHLNFQFRFPFGFHFHSDCHHQPENQVVEWNQLPSSSNGLLVPDSASEPELDAAELPGSDIISFTPLTEISETSTSSKNEHLHHDFHFRFNFHFRFPFGFHFHSDCHHQQENQVVEWNQLPSTSNSLLVPDSASESELDAAELPGSDGISVAPLTEMSDSETSTSSKNENLHYDGSHFHFNFHFRFPFGFHFHSDCHHQEKDKHEEEEEMEKQFEPLIAGEETPYSGGMVMARTAGFLPGKRVHHHEPVGDGDGMMRYEEGKIKQHKKELKKEKEADEGMKGFEEGSKMKSHKKERKKEKEDGEGMRRFEEGSKMKRHKKELKKLKEDVEEMLRFEEGSKMKHHKKEWKKGKEDDDEIMRVEEGKTKRHKKEWEKEKEDDEETMRFVEGKTKRHKEKWKREDAGLMKLFRKCLKKFKKLFY